MKPQETSLEPEVLAESLGSAPTPSEPPQTRAQVARHVASSIAATVVDFGMMIACKELLHLAPAFATAIGATSGALANFTLGRLWTFEATHSRVHGQAARYAIVSAASLGWNVVGEYLFTSVLGLQYVVARALVALVVSLLWNYPLQRFFVFRART